MHAHVEKAFINTIAESYNQGAMDILNERGYCKSSNEIERFLLNVM
jgi:hypothetical protein